MLTTEERIHLSDTLLAARDLLTGATALLQDVRAGRAVDAESALGLVTMAAAKVDTLRDEVECNSIGKAWGPEVRQ